MPTPFPLPAPDSLGQLLGADDVRDALKATIDLWSPYYVAVLSQRLATAGRIGGTSDGVKQPPNPLPPFGKWVNEPEYRSWGTGQLAACLVTATATVGNPRPAGNGQVRAVYRSQVNVQVFGTDWQETADLTSWYEKVVRWSVLQHRSLGNFANTTAWVGSSYSGAAHSSTRTLGNVVLGFDVTLDNVIEMTRGPAAVPTTPVPPGQDPTVATVTTTLTKYPVTQPLP